MIMKHDSLFISDLDGTLISSRRALVLSYSAALQQYGLRPSYEILDNLILGRHYLEFLKDLAPDLSETDMKNIRYLKNEIYLANLSEIDMNHGLLELLRHSKKASYSALATVASRDSTDAIVRHFKMGDVFDLIITGDDVSLKKPDPECFLLAMRHFNVNPERTFIFEDSQAGIAAAQKSGAHFISIKL